MPVIKNDEACSPHFELDEVIEFKCLPTHLQELFLALIDETCNECGQAGMGFGVNHRSETVCLNCGAVFHMH